MTTHKDTYILNKHAKNCNNNFYSTFKTIKLNFMVVNCYLPKIGVVKRTGVVKLAENMSIQDIYHFIFYLIIK